jgi:hypothetical protein
MPILALLNTNQRDRRAQSHTTLVQPQERLLLFKIKQSRQFRCLIGIPSLRLALGCVALGCSALGLRAITGTDYLAKREKVDYLVVSSQILSPSAAIVKHWRIPLHDFPALEREDL